MNHKEDLHRLIESQIKDLGTLIKRLPLSIYSLSKDLQVEERLEANLQNSTSYSSQKKRDELDEAIQYEHFKYEKQCKDIKKIFDAIAKTKKELEEVENKIIDEKKELAKKQNNEAHLEFLRNERDKNILRINELFALSLELNQKHYQLYLIQKDSLKDLYSDLKIVIKEAFNNLSVDNFSNQNFYEFITNNKIQIEEIIIESFSCIEAANNYEEYINLVKKNVQDNIINVINEIDVALATNLSSQQIIMGSNELFENIQSNVGNKLQADLNKHYERKTDMYEIDKLIDNINHINKNINYHLNTENLSTSSQSSIVESFNKKADFLYNDGKNLSAKCNIIFNENSFSKKKKYSFVTETPIEKDDNNLELSKDGKNDDSENDPNKPKKGV